MNADEFINAALGRLSSQGFERLDEDESLVAIISEAEVSCDLDGIESFLRNHRANLAKCASAFGEIGASEIEGSLRQVMAEMPKPSEQSRQIANDLITQRFGYTYESIKAAVTKRLQTTEPKLD